MSSKELFDEYITDLKDIQDKTIKLDGSEYVEKYLWKRRKMPNVIITKVFTAMSGNKYLGIMQYTQSGAGKRKQWNITSYHVGLMDSVKGMCAIAFYAQSGQAVKFTPHFFARYKERYLQVCDWKIHNQLRAATSIVDIISIYVKRNLSMTWIETKSVFRNKTHIFAPVDDGVALLQWDNSTKLLQANTFITMSMLDKKQSEMVRYARIYLSLSPAQRKKFRFPDFAHK